MTILKSKAFPSDHSDQLSNLLIIFFIVVLVRNDRTEYNMHCTVYTLAQSVHKNTGEEDVHPQLPKPLVE